MLSEKAEEVEIFVKEFESVVSRILMDESHEYDMNDAFGALFLIPTIKRMLSNIEEEINISMVEFMKKNGEKTHNFGDHIAERRVSSRRKNWQHQTLIEAVINTSLSDEDEVIVDARTGEVIDILSLAKPLIDNVVRNLTATAAIRDWRVTALRNIVTGLNPDDFCEVEKSEKVSILRK
jgi:hypothetical protein